MMVYRQSWLLVGQTLLLTLALAACVARLI